MKNQLAHVGRLIKASLPRIGLPDEVNYWREENQPYAKPGLERLTEAASLGFLPLHGSLLLRVRRGRDGLWLPYGLASVRVVTTAGVAYLVDALQGSVEPELLRFHGYGTGNTAENSADTELDTELTTEYATDNVRPTGTLAEGASANIFRTVGTLTPNSGSPAIVEHGIFNQAANSGGTLLDRTVFAAVNLASANGDSLETTYELTLPAGS